MWYKQWNISALWQKDWVQHRCTVNRLNRTRSEMNNKNLFVRFLETLATLLRVSNYIRSSSRQRNEYQVLAFISTCLWCRMGTTGPTGLELDKRSVPYNILLRTSILCPPMTGITKPMMWTYAATQFPLMTSSTLFDNAHYFIQNDSFTSQHVCNGLLCIRTKGNQT